MRQAAALTLVRALARHRSNSGDADANGAANCPAAVPAAVQAHANVAAAGGADSGTVLTCRTKSNNG